MDMDDPRKAIGIGCCCLSTIGLVILVFMSYSTLDATEIGLDYSSITKSVDSTIYQSGYHFIGFGHRFIKFPSTVQSMEFKDKSSILSRTEDGLQITFKATVQYQL
jgi:hypothetical protein